ncbi:hypothetical protein [Brevundimonas sp.]|uniref:hypothetical protein n=1 Tax=Brevundimonas sp. TaxID=1871086 RepID=UPI0025E6E201|nr:hypothetical protein [Brevundimonas sp.]
MTELRNGAARALMAAAGLLLLLLLPVLTGGSAGRGLAASQEEDAYSRFVRVHFIAPRRLVFNERAGDGAPIVDLAPAVYADPDTRYLEYALASFLLQDIRRNDPGLWEIDNGVVTGVTPFLHFTPPPFPVERRAWRGALRYREAAEAPVQDVIVLEGGSGTPRLRLTPSSAPIGTGDPDIRTLDLSRSAGAHEIAGRAVDVFCDGPSERPSLRIRRIGDQVGVFADDLGACVVDVGPTQLGQGARFEVLAEGERLSVRSESGRRLVLVRGGGRVDDGVVSAPGAAGGRYHASEIAQWSQAVERDVISAFSAGPPSADIVTTLDRDLQQLAQSVLDEHLSGQAGGTDEGTGAITIMDALTGEVLAMASAPRGGAQGRPWIDQDDVLGRARAVNQNLQLLPVGSAAKPLMAAAILHRSPSLLGLEIQGQQEADNLLGLPLSSPISNHLSPDWIGFDAFLRDSDNLYAASLLLLGSPDTGGQRCPLAPGQVYRLGGETLTSRPKSVFERLGRDGRCQAAPTGHDRQMRWADTLEDLFDIDAGLRSASGGVSRCASEDGGGQPSPWARLVSQYDGVDACRFVASTPQPEALGLIGARDFRSQVVPSALGNGDGVWSAVKLAEAYARLVTGVRVSASFHGTSSTSGPLGLNAEVRRRITHALTLVPAGTAASTELPGSLAALQEALAAQGQVLGAFAKTGTPVVVSRRYRPVDRAINMLIRRDRLRVSARGALQLGAQSGSRIEIRPGMSRADRERALGLLSRDAVARESLRDVAGVTPAGVIRTLERYAGQMAEGGTPFLIRQGEQAPLLVRVASRAEIIGDTGDPDTPTGKVIALVVAAYGREGLALGDDGRAYDGRARPLRAYVVVVNLQHESRGSNDAANLAARIVSRGLRDRLADGRRR